MEKSGQLKLGQKIFSLNLNMIISNVNFVTNIIIHVFSSIY